MIFLIGFILSAFAAYLLYYVNQEHLDYKGRETLDVFD
jgi:hypothetical protein